MLYPHLNGKRVILASQSPRRLELVKGLELEPVTWLKDVDESFPEEIIGPAIAEYVTRLKAEAYWDELGPNDVLITGDGTEIRWARESQDEGELRTWLLDAEWARQVDACWQGVRARLVERMDADDEGHIADLNLPGNSPPSGEKR